MAHTHNAGFYILDADASPAINPGATGARMAAVSGTTIVWFWVTGTTWQRIDIGSLSAADGNDTPVNRGNSTQNVPPTLLEIPSPVDGDTASVFLTNGMLEKWVRISGSWSLAYTLQSDLASNLAVGTVTATNVPVTNSNGTGFTLSAATNLLAGLMIAADKIKMNFLTVTGSINLDNLVSNFNDLVTLSGLAAGSVNFGIFSGSIISDNETLKNILQELETAIQAAYITGHTDTNSIDLSVTAQNITANLKLDATQDPNFQLTIGAGGTRITMQSLSSYASIAAAQADGGLAIGKDYYLNIDNLDGIPTAGTGGPKFTKI